MKSLFKTSIFVYLIFGNFIVNAQEFYDSKLRFDSFEQRFEILGIKYDSNYYDDVSTRNVELYSRIVFYLDSLTSVELLFLPQGFCYYRQFWKEREVAVGKLIVDSTQFDLYEITIHDSNGEDSLIKVKSYYFQRDGEWDESYVLEGFWVNETQQYTLGRRHGYFETLLDHRFLLQARVYDNGILHSDSVFYKTTISQEHLYGWWHVPRNHYRANLENYHNSNNEYYILYRNSNDRIFSKFELFENMTYVHTDIPLKCLEDKEDNITEGNWRFDASTQEVHFDSVHLSFRVVMLIGNLMIIEELN
jgi:hypothetical protein